MKLIFILLFNLTNKNFFSNFRYFLKNNQEKKIRGFKLYSEPIYRKYLGLFDLFFIKPSLTYCLSSFSEARAARNAMKQHKSQFVWFRRLYINFSSYMFVNILEEINPNK